MKKMIFYLGLLVASFSSCIKDTDMSSTSCAETQVQLVIGNTTSRAGGDASPDPIDRLHVYVFKANECVGYLFRENLNTSDVISLPMPLDRKKVNVGEDVYFYVLANDLPEWNLDENTSRQELDGMSFDRWEDTTVPDIAPMVNNDNADGKGGYQTAVRLTGENWQNVNVKVQPIVGRLRLFFKKEGNGDIIINKAVVYHRPDNYLLFTPRSVSAVTFIKNDESVVDNFVSNKDLKSTDDYELIGQTYLAPNAYGSSNPDNYVPAYGTSGDIDKAYRLYIEYTVGGNLKQKDVYLPQVLRNRSIDVQGILKSGSLSLAVVVGDWEDGPSFDMSYGDEFDGNLVLESKNPIVGDKSQNTDAYAVVYGDAADTRRDLTFQLKITKPIGAIWTANVTNGADFEVVKSDGTPASGSVDGNPVSISLRSKSGYVPGEVNETELYVTLINNNNENKGEQLVNPDLIHPGTTTRIRVRQISLDEWNQLQVNP